MKVLEALLIGGCLALLAVVVAKIIKGTKIKF